jgi:putative FmdB family regulatory protein
MPIYEYFCSYCNRFVEKIARSDELRSIVTCETCKKQMKKVMSAANFKIDKATEQ